MICITSFAFLIKTKLNNDQKRYDKNDIDILEQLLIALNLPIKP